MTLKDLFIKENGYIVKLEYLSGLYLYIECLNDFGDTISGDFDMNNLTDSLCIELHDNKGVIDNVDIKGINLMTKIEDININCSFNNNGEIIRKVFAEKQDYGKTIKEIKNKEDMKKLVNIMFKDGEIEDIDLSDYIYHDIIPRLKELGIVIPTWNEKTNESGYEIILKENY